MIVKLVAIDLIVVVISDVLNVGIVGVKIEVDVVVMVWLWWYNRCCVFVDDVVVVVLIRKRCYYCGQMRAIYALNVFQT